MNSFKTGAFWIVMLLATWLFIEAASYVAYRSVAGAPYSTAAVKQNMREQAQRASTETDSAMSADALKWSDFVEVLHPYFGFVADPFHNRPEWKISDSGFVFGDSGTAPPRRAPGKVIVAVFGGSFANWAFLSLRSVFESSAASDSSEYVLFNFSAAGYKQPQQLMVLNYLLSTGAEFDVVVNLDGFNEVALPPTENIPAGVNPFFPRGWERRTLTTISPAVARLIGRVDVTTRSKESWSTFFIDHSLFRSPTLSLLWLLRDRQLARVIFDTNNQISSTASRVQSFAAKGPRHVFENEDAMYRELTDVWKRSSLQMHALCKATGTRYIHFLQPNQYVPGSKPMGREEISQAVNSASPYKDCVLKGYPMLQKAGSELNRSGVDFNDLTMIYATDERVLYKDDCCHTNKDGSDVIARRIYEAIVQ